MAVSSREKRMALLEAKRLEADALASRGVVARGNGFSPVLLIKGEVGVTEVVSGAVLDEAEDAALRAALLRLGYAPEDFCVLAAVYGPGEEGAAPAPDVGEPLAADLLREAVEALDPEAVVLLDDAATAVMREAYSDALAAIDQFEVAMLEPGLVANVLGRRVLSLGGFETALADAASKQRVWAYLKRLPPAGAPY